MDHSSSLILCDTDKEPGKVTSKPFKLIQIALKLGLRSAGLNLDQSFFTGCWQEEIDIGRLLITANGRDSPPTACFKDQAAQRFEIIWIQ